MFESFKMFLLNLLLTKLKEIITEVSDKVLALVDAPESEITAWLDTLSPVARMVAEEALDLVRRVIAKVKEDYRTEGA